MTMDREEEIEIGIKIERAKEVLKDYLKRGYRDFDCQMRTDKVRGKVDCVVSFLPPKTDQRKFIGVTGRINHSDPVLEFYTEISKFIKDSRNAAKKAKTKASGSSPVKA